MDFQTNILILPRPISKNPILIQIMLGRFFGPLTNKCDYLIYLFIFYIMWLLFKLNHHDYVIILLILFTYLHPAMFKL